MLSAYENKLAELGRILREFHIDLEKLNMLAFMEVSNE